MISGPQINLFTGEVRLGYTVKVHEKMMVFDKPARQIGGPRQPL